MKILILLIFLTFSCSEQKPLDSSNDVSTDDILSVIPIDSVDDGNYQKLSTTPKTNSESIQQFKNVSAISESLIVNSKKSKISPKAESVTIHSTTEPTTSSDDEVKTEKSLNGSYQTTNTPLSVYSISNEDAVDVMLISEKDFTSSMKIVPTTDIASKKSSNNSEIDRSSLTSPPSSFASPEATESVILGEIEEGSMDLEILVIPLVEQDKSNKSDVTNKSIKSDQSGESDESIESDESDEANESDEFDESNESNESDQSNESNESNESDESNESEENGEFESSSISNIDVLQNEEFETIDDNHSLSTTSALSNVENETLTSTVPQDLSLTSKPIPDDIQDEETEESTTDLESSGKNTNNSTDGSESLVAEESSYNSAPHNSSDGISSSDFKSLKHIESVNNKQNSTITDSPTVKHSSSTQMSSNNAKGFSNLTTKQETSATSKASTPSTTTTESTLEKEIDDEELFIHDLLDPAIVLAKRSLQNSNIFKNPSDIESDKSMYRIQEPDAIGDHVNDKSGRNRRDASWGSDSNWSGDGRVASWRTSDNYNERRFDDFEEDTSDYKAPFKLIPVFSG